jgi:hypothetical protein
MISFPEWIEPKAATLTWTGNCKLRHRRLVGIRKNKVARDVGREQP